MVVREETMPAHTIRLFVSSPRDVEYERRRVDRVAQRLNVEFDGTVRIQTIRWETSFYSAHADFQAQIPEASDCDIVVAIFWSRLGTELPPNFPHKLDGEPYPSGTAYEVLSAIKARESKNFPDIFVFRKKAPALLPIDDELKLASGRAQWEKLESFFERWFITPQGHFRAAFNTFVTSDQFEADIEKLLREWIAKRFGSQFAVWPIPTRGSPFRGLEPFDLSHAQVFFGRSREIALAAERLASASKPALLIVGASGAGKSSLARAGLIPRITAPGFVENVDVWRVAVMRPGTAASPVQAFARALFAAPGGDGQTRDYAAISALPELGHGDFANPDALASLLAAGTEVAARPLIAALDRVGAEEQSHGGFDRAVRANLLVLIDQLDDLFAVNVSDRDRDQFSCLLGSLLATGRIWLVATLRASFYERFLDDPNLRSLKDSGADLDLSRPGPAELAEIVRKPAEAAGLLYERAAGKSLDDRLLEDASGSDTLPLLQFTLQRLFEQRTEIDDKVLLTFAAYEAMGGLDGAINEAAERAFHEAGAPAGELSRLLRQLVVPVGYARTGTAGRSALTIRTVPLQSAAPASAAALVDRLTDARILLLESEDGTPSVRLVHQRVLESWQRAREIAKSNADFYRIRGEIEEQMQRWAASGHKAELLLPRGLPLVEAENLSASFRDEISPEISAFIAMSGRRARRTQRLITVVAAVFAVLALAASLLGFAAFRSARMAAEAALTAAQQANHAQVAQSRFLADLADQSFRNDDSATAIDLALEALPDADAGIQRPYLPEAEAALFSARLDLQEIAVLAGHTGAVSSAAISPDGSRVVTTSADRTARIWDIGTGKLLMTLTGHEGEVTMAAWCPDGTCVATASGDKTARLWDAASGKQIVVFKGHDHVVRSVAFSPNGEYLVTASYDKTARIWDVKTGRQILSIPGIAARDMVSSAAFSPDGKLVATATAGLSLPPASAPAAQIFDAATGKEVMRLGDQSGSVLSIKFSPDGRHLLTASADSTAKIWDLATGNPIHSLPHPTVVSGADFDPSGELIVTAAYDGKARLWDAETGKLLTTYVAGAKELHSAVFSPRGANGLRIVTASADKTARIWGPYAWMREGIRLRHRDWVNSVSFSADGRYVVTACSDGTSRIWDAATGAPLVTLKGHQGPVWSAAFSADGARVVTASEDKTARIWDAKSGAPLHVLSGHGDWVRSAAFSPDGQRVVTASGDGTARIWDANTGKSLLVLGSPAVNGHPLWMRGAAFSPDGRFVATASDDETARIWDAATGTQIRVFTTHQRGSAMWSAVFGPHGHRLLTASEDKTARLWDVETGKELAVFAGHGGEVLAATFSPDGTRVLTASQDKTARIWDAATARELAILPMHTRSVRSGAFSPDGRRVATGSVDGLAWIVGVYPRTQDLVEDAKRAVPRCLTREQRAKPFLDPEPPAWCIEMRKWPYDTQDWRDWLSFKKMKANPPLPGTPDWQPFLTKHQAHQAGAN
jgi:WD40 repeat protein